MGKINVCIIGAGNISNTRHIPAIMKERRIKIVGIISDNEEKIKYTKKKNKLECHELVIDREKSLYEQMRNCDWFLKRVDAVVIGTPPMCHYECVRGALLLGKHTLVEKPMMMSVAECEDVIKIAKEKHLVLNVMHSFQFASGMQKLYTQFQGNQFGNVESLLEVQLTNRNRRLPSWYNELPLGLFYDEAAHFFYSARRFGGRLVLKQAHAVFNNKEDATPRCLSVQMDAGDVPLQMYMNFNSPICEWLLVLVGEKKIAVYDYFKDILVVLNNDGEHLAKDVLRTSLAFFFMFWKGFVKNGFRMITGRLLYGHDECISRFCMQIENKCICYELSAELGLEVVKAMGEVVDYVKR